MTQITRRNFLLFWSTLAAVPVLCEEAAGQVKGFSLDSPVNNSIIIYSPGSLSFHASSFRNRQRRRRSFPRVARINYKINNVFVGTGTEENFFLCRWQPPRPNSNQGETYVLTAEAVQAGTENIVGTISVSFRVFLTLG